MAGDGSPRLALLLEVAPDGRPAKLELAAAAGLLTLHPEPGGSALHGNVVSAAGVRHLALPWSPERVVVVAGSPVAAAVAAGGAGAGLAPGEGRTVAGVEVDERLEVRPAAWRLERTGPRHWRLARTDGGGPSVELELDGDGVPSVLADADGWPLEVEASG